MVIEGSFESLKNNDSFDMIDENGMKVLSVSRNSFLPDKLYIKNSNNGKEYIGQIIHSSNAEEFIFYEDTTQIFHISQKSGLGMPKFEITSQSGEFNTKFSIRKRNLILFDGEKEAATLIGSPPNYKIIIEDVHNTFDVLCIAYAMTILIPFKTLYSLLS